MPTHRHPDQKGDLIISFTVEFPDKIPVKNIAPLSKLLPGPSMDDQIIPDGAQHIKLMHVSESMLRNGRGEDDEGNGPQGVRCATQ